LEKKNSSIERAKYTGKWVTGTDFFFEEVYGGMGEMVEIISRKAKELTKRRGEKVTNRGRGKVSGSSITRDRKGLWKRTSTKDTIRKIKGRVHW